MKISPLDLKNRITIYLIVVLLSLAGVVYVMKLWEADLSIPLQYGGDSLGVEALVKGGIDNPWYFYNSFIGGPQGRDIYDHPIADNNLHLLLLKFLSLIIGNPFAATNVYYLLTFPLTAVIALFVFRHFKIAAGPAILASLLFTFLPYHFMRGLLHLFLSGYYLIPLAVMVCLWIYSDSPPLSTLSIKRWNLNLNTLTKRDIACILICVLVGSAGAYYAFFTSFLMAVASLAAAISEKAIKRVVPGIALGSLVLAIVLINISPSIIYRLTHGANQEAVHRYPGEAETYGLKITHLLLPPSGHRLRFFEKIKQGYYKSSPLTEGDSSSLGLIASGGFLLLLYYLLFRRSGDGAQGYTACLSILNGASLLLATLGSFGAIIAFLFPYIRAYNRISIFIAFFSLFAVAILLDKLWEKYCISKSARILAYAGVCALLILGLLDQTNKHYSPDYSGIKKDFMNDSNFARQIEASVPGGVIFQLPYQRFPEAGAVHLMQDYDLFRPYLHSQSLRWSYGSMRGRTYDLWQRQITSKPTQVLLDILAMTDYSGIYIDRDGYKDDAAALEKELSGLLGSIPLVSDNGRYSFFSIVPYKQKLLEQTPTADSEARRELELNPILYNWTGGFYYQEELNGEKWRWCDGEGQLVLINNSEQQRTVIIDMRVQTGDDQMSELVMNSDLFTTTLSVNSQGTRYSKRLDIPPGSHTIKLSCNARRVDAPQDLRELVFRVINFSLNEVM